MKRKKDDILQPRLKLYLGCMFLSPLAKVDQFHWSRRCRRDFFCYIAGHPPGATISAYPATNCVFQTRQAKQNNSMSPIWGILSILSASTKSKSCPKCVRKSQQEKTTQPKKTDSQIIGIKTQAPRRYNGIILNVQSSERETSQLKSGLESPGKKKKPKASRERKKNRIKRQV